MPPPARRRAPRLAPATLSEADGVRYLHLGTPWVQGAMRLRKPRAIELDYVQRMLASLLMRPEAARDAPDAWHGVRTVQFGLGAATLTRFCHGELGADTTAVEINPTVIEACRLWFKLPADDARLNVIETDAAAYAADPRHAGSADLLWVDLYDHEAASPVLDSSAFYADCARLLAPGGVMSVNLFGRDLSFERSLRRIVGAFAGHLVMSLQPTREGNTVVLAAKLPAWPPREALSERAAAVQHRFGLPARKWLRMWRALPALPVTSTTDGGTDEPPAPDGPDLPDDGGSARARPRR